MVMPHDVDVDILTSWAASDLSTDVAGLYETPAELRLRLFWPAVAPGGDAFWSIIENIATFFISSSPALLEAGQLLGEGHTNYDFNFVGDKASTLYSADKQLCYSAGHLIDATEIVRRNQAFYGINWDQESFFWWLVWVVLSPDAVTRTDRTQQVQRKATETFVSIMKLAGHPEVEALLPKPKPQV